MTEYKEEETEPLQYTTLLEYVICAQSRYPSLGKGRIAAATLEDIINEQHLIVPSVAHARLSIFLAEALYQMSEDIHTGDDIALRDAPLTRNTAIVLVKQYGGVRPASRATGIGRERLRRALKEVAV